MYQSFENISIDGISSCVPKNRVGNDTFSELLSPKEIKMFEKTVGILERRWTAKGVTASDLGFEAASDLFSDPRFKKEDIKCLIFISQTSDYKIPFTSNILQDRLGLSPDILCLDINAGCAGFVQGLSMAYSMANSLENGKVLLIVAETLSKILSLKDRGTTMLFGDAASAAIISKKENGTKSHLNFFTDGKNHDAIQIPDGGYRNPVGDESLSVFERENGNLRSNMNLSMDGPKVFDFTLREVAAGVSDLLNHFSEPIDEIGYFLFHQSNRFIINQIASQLSIPKDKVLINIQSYGNTSGVTLPLLITTHKDNFKDKNARILCSGYGSGLTWGNAVITIDKETVIRDLIEY